MQRTCFSVARKLSLPKPYIKTAYASGYCEQLIVTAALGEGEDHINQLVAACYNGNSSFKM